MCAGFVQRRRSATQTLRCEPERVQRKTKIARVHSIRRQAKLDAKSPALSLSLSPVFALSHVRGLSRFADIYASRQLCARAKQFNKVHAEPCNCTRTVVVIFMFSKCRTRDAMCHVQIACPYERTPTDGRTNACHSLHPSAAATNIKGAK